MTYISTHLPTLEELKLELESNPNKIQLYAKYEGFDGSSESIDFLFEKLEEYYKTKKND